MGLSGARRLVFAAGTVVIVILAVVMINASRWVGDTFPGFFVMANRVVPSVSPLDWFWADPSHLFQHEIVAVDGFAVATASEIYAQVRKSPPGTPIHYLLQAPNAERVTVVIASRQLSGFDCLLIFGAFLLCGGTFLLAGLTVFYLRPRRAASYGLLSAGLSVGLFAVTAADLYGPQWLFRLHVACESMAAAGLIHLALVFPTDRLRRHRGVVLNSLYLPFAALAVWYEIALYQPSAYRTAHLLASIGHGVAALAIIVSVTYDLLTSRSVVVRRRIGIVGLGACATFLLPAVILAGSGFLGGRAAVSWVNQTVIFFPLSLAYAVATQDLFDNDIVLRRGLTYLIVVTAIGMVYAATVFLYGVVVPGRALPEAPAQLALLNFVLLLLLAPIRMRVTQAVDRVFFRQRYDIETVLSTLSHALASVHTQHEVLGRTRQGLDAALSPTRLGMLHRQQEEWIRYTPALTVEAVQCELAPKLAARLERGELLARYEWDDGTGRQLPAVWDQLGAEVLVPIRTEQRVVALMTLGPKSSGRAYSANDMSLLRAAANQIALALTNAVAFGRMQDLNRSLERLNLGLEQQVRERTTAVHAANAELQRSLNELRLAYEQLEHKQAIVLRAERLATLGHLSAGIAHEMNTPLSAVLNALKIIGDLGREYASSLDDAAVLPEDHREIAGEIVSTAQAASEWAAKAAAFIRSVKTHGRDPQPSNAERFAIAAVVSEIQTLLAHRLRAGSCQLRFTEDVQGISLLGDPSRLNQVLVNLIDNAIDAYEDAGITGGVIDVHAARNETMVDISVRDAAGGIPAHVLPHIFQELFTTKGRGRGTGLGLWIARNLIGEGFGGKLDVLTAPGLGSCFTASVPMEGDGRIPVESPPLDHEEPQDANGAMCEQDDLVSNPGSEVTPEQLRKCA